jgi:hypothetical protein
MITANNLSRHVATHGDAPSTNGSKPKRKSSKSGRAASNAVARYLDEVAEGATRGASVYLGKLPGYPWTTTDPDVVDQAADDIAKKADAATSRLVEVKLRQRVANLRVEAEDLRAEESGEDAESEFVEVAAAWAEANGIAYETFRDMGVPARVLRAAGISRT